MSHYLVTGGAGFIGSHLVDALIRGGHSVRVLDDLSTGKRENVNAAAEFIQGSVTDLETVQKACQNMDGVFHLAAIVSVPLTIERPVESARVNMMGTVNVFVAARDQRVKRVVYSASGAAYGNHPELPYRVDMPPSLLSPYALQKWVGEKWAEMANRFYGLETVSLRYFNVYGPRMNDQGAYVPVFSYFIRQKLAHQPLTIHGDGEQTRDFIHVSDVVAANVAAMTSPRVGHGDVLNVGTGVRTRINEIAKMIGGDVVHLPARPGDPRDAQADITLTKERLSWEPRVAFAEGLRELMQASGLI